MASSAVTNFQVFGGQVQHEMFMNNISKRSIQIIAMKSIGSMCTRMQVQAYRLQFKGLTMDLLNTLRSMAYVSLVVEAFNTFKKAAIPSVETENIQLAMLFYIAGRGNEMGHTDNPGLYAQFRKKSAHLFESYAREHLPF